MRYNIIVHLSLVGFLYYYTAIVDHGLGEIYNDYSLDVSYLMLEELKYRLNLK